MKKIFKTLLKCKLFISISFLTLALPVSIKAQNTPIIYQNWKMIGESPTNYEVSALILRCHPDSVAQVHIELFNEGIGAQTAHFNLTITSPSNNENIQREISYSMAQGDMIKPLCENNNHPLLRINFPANWDPAAVIFTLTFIP